MLVLTKVLTALLVPPGLLVLGLAAAAVLIVIRRRIWAVALTGICCAGLVFASTEVLSHGFVRALEDHYPALTPLDVAAMAGEVTHIVVLGGGMQLLAPDAGGAAVLSSYSMRRALHALRLHRATGLPNVLSGGRVLRGEEVPAEEVPAKGSPAEADVAATFLEDLGVDPSRLIREDQSRTTWENAVEVSRLLGNTRIVLVTSAFHMARAVFCFERNGLEVVPAPADYLTDYSKPTVLSYLPDARPLCATFLAVREYAALLVYRLRYRRATPDN